MPPDVRRALTVVARVVPEQKVHVVEWLQEAGEVVAMLGDGVNDAPALRRADIGVAAGRSGSEVAKEAADLVLTDDELGSVVAAVEEGRRIYANIRAFLLYAVSGGLAEVGVMVAGSLVGLAVPLLPGQILWINLLTHGLVGVAFGSEPLDAREMTLPPRPPTRGGLHPGRAGAAGVGDRSSLVIAALRGGCAHDGRRRRTPDRDLPRRSGAGQLGVALALRARRTGTRRRGSPAGHGDGARRAAGGSRCSPRPCGSRCSRTSCTPTSLDLRTTLVARGRGRRARVCLLGAVAGPRRRGQVPASPGSDVGLRVG